MRAASTARYTSRRAEPRDGDGRRRVRVQHHQSHRRRAPVRLEYEFLRELKPIRGWVERRLASVTALAYDLSYKHQPRHSPAELLDRLGVLFERMGAPAVPEVFNWLSRSPVVLEGVLEMIEVTFTSAGVHVDLLREAAAIAVASRAMSGSGLGRAVDQWLAQGSLPNSNTLLSCAARSGVTSDSDLVSACRRYSWQVANAAYTISHEEIRTMSRLGFQTPKYLISHSPLRYSRRWPSSNRSARPSRPSTHHQPSIRRRCLSQHFATPARHHFSASSLPQQGPEAARIRSLVPAEAGTHRPRVSCSDSGWPTRSRRARVRAEVGDQPAAIVVVDRPGRLRELLGEEERGAITCW